MSRTYFSRYVNGGPQLWTSNGTVSGSLFVSAVTEGHLTGLAAVGKRLYFQDYETSFGNQAWTSDGTGAGTVKLTSALTYSELVFTSFNGAAFFSAYDSAVLPGHGVELWKSTGSGAGTAMFKDIYNNPTTAQGSSPVNLTKVGGTLFFMANDYAPGVPVDNTNGPLLWKTDGTVAGTVVVKDFQPGLAADPNFRNPTNVNGTLFFTVNDAVNGQELWKSDGTTGGTVLVKDILPGPGGFPDYLANCGGTLYFFADDGTNGNELWKSDGTSGGTVMVKNINPGAGNGSPRGMTYSNGRTFFYATDGTNGYELWKTDGTDAGTVMVKDIRAGGASSSPSNLLYTNGVLEFYATADGATYNLYALNPANDAITMLVADIDTNTNLVATTAPPAGDLSGDSYADILWRNTSNTLAVWTMGGTSGTTIQTGNGIASSPGSTWAIQGVGDFNGDGGSDILWRNSSNALAVWTMGGTAGTTILTGNGIGSTPGSDWAIQGVGDFNGDGNSDILWRNNDATLAIWTMGGATGTTLLTGNGIGSAPDGSWRIVGNGDFNGDGNSDILWRNNQSGILAVWTMGGSTGTTIQTGNAIGSVPGLTWHVVGTGDFNGDSKSDILWRNDSGALAIWTMGGASGSTILTGNGIGSMPDASWSVATTGDFNSDGTSDILWRNTSGALAVWTMGGTSGTSILTGNGIGSTPDSSWSVQKHVYEIV